MTDTRTHIIETAFILFLRKGFKGVKLTDIEKFAGITRGTLYYHFSGKEEILKEGLVRYYHMIALKMEIKTGQIFTLKDYIQTAVHELNGLKEYSPKSFTHDIPDVLWLLLSVEVISLFPELKEMILQLKMKRLLKLEQLIFEAKQRGEIKTEPDTSVLAKNILNIGAGILNYLLMSQDISYACSSIQAQYEQLYQLIHNR